MKRKQTIIFFLMAAALIVGPSIALSFWGVNDNNRLLQKASLSVEENNNNNIITAQLRQR